MVKKYLSKNISTRHMLNFPVKIVFSLIDSFSKLSRQCPNVRICETAGIGIVKNVNMPLCGMRNVDLTK